MTVSILSDSVVSPLGVGSEVNFCAIQQGNSGINRIDNTAYSEQAFYGAWIDKRNVLTGFTWFESLAIQSVHDALTKSNLRLDLTKTAFVLATTKGNIERLADPEYNRNDLLLHQIAKKIAAHIGVSQSYVVSNACASSVMAVMLGKHLLEAGTFEHAIITGADVLSKFVVSGFKSLHALSDAPCKPFDSARNGLNLGEAAATIILSSVHTSGYGILGSGATNDANHISGPSRTGEELSMAITRAMTVCRQPVDFISAHGTATNYNDEMEANAFHRAGINHTPVNSLKGYFGHTLGAAGLVEISMSLQSLKHQELIASKGYEHHGVSIPLNVIRKIDKSVLNSFLKTASGFGGCNAAIVIGKLD